jgi:molybdenum cofactor biosynthesis enzyme MoaA
VASTGGITEVRFTGGEPLLRRGLPSIVARTAALNPRPDISLTTNGIGLARLAAAPGRAGPAQRLPRHLSLDAEHGWRRTDLITADEILAALSAQFSLTPADPTSRASVPAETFVVDGGPTRVGVIGSVTRPICGACDRSG